VVIPLLLIAFSLSGSAQAVTPVAVHGTWEITDYGRPLVCGTCDEFPLTLGLSAPQVCPTCLEVVRQGAATEIDVHVTSLVPSVITLRKPVYLRVRIKSTLDSGCCPVVWEGILPPLAGPISPGWSASLRILWDHQGSFGRPVPRGTYLAAIVFPVTIVYTIGGTVGEERLTQSSAHLLGGEIYFVRIEVQ
jgi:hypothetical protein